MTTGQQIQTKTIQAWRRNPLQLDKQEVIFLIGQ